MILLSINADFSENFILIQFFLQSKQSSILPPDKIEDYLTKLPYLLYLNSNLPTNSFNVITCDANSSLVAEVSSAIAELS